MPAFPKWSLSFRFPHQNPVHPSPLPPYALHAPPISFSSSLCSFLHSPVTSSLLGSNIFLSTLFANTLSLCSSLNVSDQVSHSYKTTGRITKKYTYAYTYSFFNLCMEFHVSRMQNKICLSFPNHTEGPAGLTYTKLIM